MKITRMGLLSLCHLPSPIPLTTANNSSPSSWAHSLVLVTSTRLRVRPIAAENVALSRQTIDKSSLVVAETAEEDALGAAACLRVRSFHQFPASSYGVEEHQKYLAEREFEALKERVAGKRLGFNRVSCINATLPASQITGCAKDLCTTCKYTENGEDRVVVGTLDLNQCIKLPDEITGSKPQGIGADFARAYLSNVCVAKELQRNGLGYSIIAKSKVVAQEWGITDLYVHVAANNEPAKQLYIKSGFIHESEEPAWQARFLERPRRIILWHGLPGHHH